MTLKKPKKPNRLNCQCCGQPIPPTRRSDALYCTERCRKRAQAARPEAKERERLRKRIWTSEAKERERLRKRMPKAKAIARMRYDRIRADPIWRAKDATRRKTARFKLIGPRSRRKLKLQGLVAYGGPNPKCAWCGESDPANLSLDHVNGDGAAHRRALGAGGRGRSSDYVYRRLRDLGWPNDPPIQVLCIGHNTMKNNQPNDIAYAEALRLARAIVRMAGRQR